MGGQKGNLNDIIALKTELLFGFCKHYITYLVNFGVSPFETSALNNFTFVFNFVILVLD